MKKKQLERQRKNEIYQNNMVLVPSVLTLVKLERVLK